MFHRIFRGCAVGLALLVTLCYPLAAFAVGSGPIRTPEAPRAAEPARPQGQLDAVALYNRGLQYKAVQRFPEAAADFRRAVDQRADFPEAWNELGFALRHLSRYSDAVQAYDQALRLRPNFPEALEYLGEAYVKMGQMERAREILDRLRLLDAGHAKELEEAIQAGT